MKLEFKQDFRIPHSLPLEQARRYLQDPLASLGGVGFMRGLTRQGDVVRAELLVQVPMLGELPLPFESNLEPTADGALLHPRTLSGRGWAKVGGEGTAREGELLYRLEVEVHVEVPGGGDKWGGLAFRKMVDATSKKALERVVLEFPRGVQSGMERFVTGGV